MRHTHEKRDHMSFDDPEHEAMLFWNTESDTSLGGKAI